MRADAFVGHAYIFIVKFSTEREWLFVLMGVEVCPLTSVNVTERPNAAIEWHVVCGLYQTFLGKT
jgi:hypothetical protein